MIVMWHLFMEIFKITLLLSTPQAMLTQYELQNTVFINVFPLQGQNVKLFLLDFIVQYSSSK